MPVVSHSRELGNFPTKQAVVKLSGAFRVIRWDFEPDDTMCGFGCFRFAGFGFFFRCCTHICFLLRYDKLLPSYFKWKRAVFARLFVIVRSRPTTNKKGDLGHAFAVKGNQLSTLCIAAKQL